MTTLKIYQDKRNFEVTPEPKGVISKESGFRFVIQRHEATRLHYDLRLEMGGVLKSWAVPKGPTLNPAEKRLAMQTEDHPVEYLTFKGSIPEGNYGAGKMTIWDKGTFQPVNEKHEPLTEDEALKWLAGGQVKFALKGRKVKSEFALINLKKDESGKTWLLIKHRDKYALDHYDSEEHVRGAKKGDTKTDPIPVQEKKAPTATKRSSKAKK